MREQKNRRNTGDPSPPLLDRIRPRRGRRRQRKNRLYY